LYKELKKPKEKRNTLWTIGFGLQTIYLVTKLALTPLYICNGIKTNEWNFIDYVKEKVIGLEKDTSKLEKIINFENIKLD
jgi:hypothetical protein